MDIKLLLLCIVLLAHCCASEHLCLYNEGENACTACSRQYANNFSLHDLPIGNYTVQFCSRHFRLTSLLSVTDSFSVIMKGLPSILECTVPEAGLLVSSVSQFALRDITLLSCGGNQYFNYHTVSAIIVANCSHVTIDRLNVNSSIGTGLSMLNNSGRIVIQNSMFEKSGHEDDMNGTSGLYIEISSDRLECNLCSWEENLITKKQNYTIINCTFSENINNVSSGGGMFVIFANGSANNQLTIMDSNFTDNVAVAGGGLFATLQRSTRNNFLVIRHSFFSGNTAYHSGGGLNVDCALNSSHSANNVVSLTDCLFSENRAESGGGISYYSNPSPVTAIQLIFRGCNWTGNVADFGAAVDMTLQYWSKYIGISGSVLFQDCIFRLNGSGPKDPSLTSYVRGIGTLTCVRYNINFKGKIVFEFNNNSAIYLSSSRLHFLANSTVEFVGNRGFEGGAIYLLGYSILVLHENIQLTFRDNVAEEKGGAIFQLNIDKTISFSKECLFSYSEEKKNSISAEVIFHNNSVVDKASGSYGSSIYATTLHPCKRQCKTESDIPAEIFKCIGRFAFQNSLSVSPLSTDGNEVSKNADALTVVPGSTVELPVTTRDDLSHELEPVYRVQVLKSPSSSVTIIDKTSLSDYVIDRNVVVFGEPDDTAVLEVATTTAREVVVYLHITMQDCPPGFVLKDRKCVCIDRIYKHYRNVISSCFDENMTATLALNHWMGYTSYSATNSCIQKSLQVSVCPRDQCYSPSNDDTPHFLPQNNSVAALTRYVCGESREGVLCSKCRDGYVLHFHDDINSCKKSMHSLCYLGWLFYILSEIVPVTVFFSILMLFDFRLMDGAVNGFILFAQLSSSSGYFHFQGTPYHFLRLYKLLVGIWNLEFFRLSSLSFCLWKSATRMDLIAFKYVTIFYSLLLVFIIIACFQYCRNKKACIFFAGVQSTKIVIIHGIASFLILRYFNFVNVSLHLLTAVRIRGYTRHHLVAYFDGELFYFTGKHLYYALPAVVIVLVFGLIPPIVLISYPLCYQIFSLFKVGESRFVALLCIIVPLEKFKPFFDSFQFSFKDKYRYFSGLYFFYRFSFLVIRAFADRAKFLYAYLQIQFILMLVVHAICQPYKQYWHNILDSILIMDLAIVNAITLINYYHTVYLADSTYYLHIASVLQLILLYIPFVYITAYLSKAILKKVWLWKFKVTEPSDCDYHEMVESLPLDAAEERLRN